MKNELDHSKVTEFIPTSFIQAVEWYFSVGSYNLSQIVAREPIKVSSPYSLLCSEMFGKKFYVIVFGNPIDSISLAPEQMQKIPKETFRQVSLFEYLQIFGVRRFPHCLGQSIVFAFCCSAVIGGVLIRNKFWIPLVHFTGQVTSSSCSASSSRTGLVLLNLLCVVLICYILPWTLYFKKKFASNRLRKFSKYEAIVISVGSLTFIPLFARILWKC